MSKVFKIFFFVFSVILIISIMSVPTFAESSATNTPATQEVSRMDNAKGAKAISSAIIISLASLGGTISMGIAISKSVESISHNPETDSKIRATLMLGLVFIETAIIYALIIAILVIFVL